MLTISIITGAKNSGKTTFIVELLGELTPETDAAGFYTKKLFKDEYFLGYNLVEIGTGEEYPFIRLEGNPDYPRMGIFYFIPAGIEEGCRILESSLDSGILVIDEAGPLELDGGGIDSILKDIMAYYDGKLVITIRDHLVGQFIETYFKDIQDIKIYTLLDKAALLEGLTKD